MAEMNICGACERHVYVHEPACPFCGSTETRLSAAPTLGGRRLSRAAAHAARAAILAGVVSCSEAHTPDADAAPSNDGGGTSQDGAVADAEPADDAGASFDGGTRQDAGASDGAVADASPDDASAEDASDNADADTAIYGGVFPDPRKRAVV